MAKVVFRFNAELNDFLPHSQRQVSFSHVFKERASIKDMIEALGVPHTEVNCILVNAEAVDFSYIVQDGDRIDVYPSSTSTEATPLVSLRPQLPSILRFVLDVHLGKLASSLRLLGFDTLYRNDYDDEELAEISASQQRILLTRDKGLLMRSLVIYGYYVRATQPEQQIVEVMRRFDLFEKVLPFHRCIRCNGLLESVSKESILDQLPEKTRLEINEFHRCCGCNQVYWRGSHYERMQQFIDGVLDAQEPA
ncbi:Mut7-C RNAse domain-containing protein [Allocoleopsis sp.]|uniref:Mut7-C RNAse domain-containing protein n=1 Tax=Allocoleopsis sp. TaxID=3088169 RepID=UPI0032C235BD